MNIGKPHVGIRFERVVHTIAMMGIDIHVSNSLHAKPASQHFYCHTAIVEHAKARRVVARGMVKPGNRDEGTFNGALHHRLDADQRRADDV